MRVYKLVRRARDRRISAILPEHLAETYREGKTNRTVPKALAFDNPRDARKWRMKWLKKGLRLELWIAEAETTAEPHAIVTQITGRWRFASTTTVREISPDLLNREAWLEMLRQIEAKGENYWTHVKSPFGEPLEALPFKAAPEGSVLCTNLTLKRRLLW
jgi:hypothetical protein